MLATRRLVDVTNPVEPRETGIFRPPEAAICPPRDLSVFSPQRAAVQGRYAAVPWNSAGVRVLDLASGTPREIASFVPPDVADPAGLLPARPM